MHSIFYWRKDLESRWNLAWLFSVRFGCLWARICSQITISPKIGFHSKTVCRNCRVMRYKHNESFWNSIHVQTASIPTVMVKRHGFILAQLIQSVTLSGVVPHYTKGHRLVCQSELMVLQNTTRKWGNQIRMVRKCILIHQPLSVSVRCEFRCNLERRHADGRLQREKYDVRSRLNLIFPLWDGTWADYLSELAPNTTSSCLMWHNGGKALARFQEK